jgi:hypothetical protein
MAAAFHPGVHGCIQGWLQLKRQIHTARGIPWKLFLGRAGLGGDGAGHELDSVKQSHLEILHGQILQQEISGMPKAQEVGVKSYAL